MIKSSFLRVITSGAIISTIPSALLALKTLSTNKTNKLIKFMNIKLLTSLICIILLQIVARSKKPLVLFRHTYFQKMFCYFLVSFMSSLYPIYFLTHNGVVIFLNYLTRIDKCLEDTKKFCEIIACMYV